MNSGEVTKPRARSSPEVRFDGGRHHRARLGFVVLAMEQTVESDMFALVPPGVGVHFSRAAMANRIDVATLLEMAEGIGEAAALLLPDRQPDVVCYACTSGSVVIGEERVFAELRRGAPKARATCLISSVMQALRAVGARKVAVATPYLDPVNEIERVYLERNGFEIVNMEGLGIENDADMARLAPDFIAEFARYVDRAEADALFVSCGALRAVEIIDGLEAQLNKPVITSNQAMLWNCLRLAGVHDRMPRHGQLLRDH
ncbi:maleate cis-trans isomerase family protein [Chelativorans xinjiangense]|uniref:maleate cis-trans isomerase family protein n=1 Tax=Chelativorans xinjiangense TaxID=2681485 RepID=UPI001358DC8A|nr:arylmalonate decarboxylase [Chelativorans xinjiangense]